MQDFDQGESVHGPQIGDGGLGNGIDRDGHGTVERFIGRKLEHGLQIIGDDPTARVAATAPVGMDA